MALVYKGAYSSGDTVYILNEYNNVQTQWNITTGYTIIGQPDWSQDGRGGTITMIVENDSSKAKYIMTYNHMGTRLSMSPC
ncbi:MAG: hypothetical protein EBU90_20015 [Proteobacteria bacterium]|nr:hypothetical protein [Pseudomonadota bacterium]